MRSKVTAAREFCPQNGHGFRYVVFDVLAGGWRCLAKGDCQKRAEGEPTEAMKETFKRLGIAEEADDEREN